MAMGTDIWRMHKHLYTLIGDEIPINGHDYRMFKHFIPLTKREKECNIESVEDLLNKWEDRGGISEGQYGNLLRLLADARLIKALNIAKTHIDAVHNQLHIDGGELYSEAERMHAKLYLIIGEQLPTTYIPFSEFKRWIPLSPRDKEHNIRSAEHLLAIWESRGGFYLGNYNNLVEVLQDAKLILISHLVKEQIDRIMKTLAERDQKIKQADRYSTPEEAPSPPNEYPSRDDPLHSYGSPTKDHLKLIQLELTNRYSDVLRRFRPIQWSEVELHLDHIYTNLEIVPGRKHQLSKGTRCDEKPTLSSIFTNDTSERSVCFIEGPAGIGKSTLCKHLVYTWSKNNFSIEGHSFDLAFLLEAQALKGDFKKCIKEHLFPNEFALSEDTIYECLLNHQEQCLLIIDGVDELTPEGKHTVLKLLNGTNLRRLNLVLTGRVEKSVEFVNNVKSHLKLTGFSEQNVQAYIGKHFNSGENKLMNRLETDRTLREIMTNPLTALLVCLLVEDNKGEIPEQSIEIQSKILHVICRKYVTRNKVGGSVHLTEINLFSAACHIAYTGLKQGIVSYPEQTLESSCQDGFGEHLVNAGLLNRDIILSRLDPTSFYSFPHKSFQEILCAKYLAELSVEELKNELASSPKFMESEKSMILMLAEMLQSENKINVVYESLTKWNKDNRLEKIGIP